MNNSEKYHPTFDDRNCKLCNYLVDDFHFVFKCPVYDDIRKQNIGHYYFRRPSMFKFIELALSKGKSHVKNLATLILRRLLQGMDICFYA